VDCFDLLTISMIHSSSTEPLSLRVLGFILSTSLDILHEEPFLLPVGTKVYTLLVFFFMFYIDFLFLIGVTELSIVLIISEISILALLPFAESS